MNKLTNWLPGLLISLAAIAILLKVVKWQGVGEAFSRVGIGPIAAGIGLTLTFLLVRGEAWRQLLDGRPGFWLSFRIICEGYLVNNILVHRAGELARAVFMGQVKGIGTARALSSILLERLLDVLFAAAFFLLCLPLVAGGNWAKTAGIISLAIVVAGLIALFLAARSREKTLGWLESRNIRGKFWNNWIKPQLHSLFEGLAVINQPRRFLLAVGLIGFSWISSFLTHFIFLKALIPGAKYWWGAFTDTFLAMGIALPSVPSAIGVFEAAVVGAVALLGVATSTGLAFALILHVLQFSVTGILGLIGLALDGRNLAQLKVMFQNHESS